MMTNGKQLLRISCSENLCEFLVTNYLDERIVQHACNIIFEFIELIKKALLYKVKPFNTRKAAKTK